MVTAAAGAAVILALAACARMALRGHQDGHGRLACLRRTIAIHALIAATCTAICAVRIARTLRHPARHARCAATRITRRVPRRDPDGEPLDPGEARDFIAICRGWKHPAPAGRSRT